MRDIHRYFDIIHSTIIHSIAMDYKVEYLPISQTESYIEGFLYFADESRLEFTVSRFFCGVGCFLPKESKSVSVFPKNRPTATIYQK